MGVVGYNFFFNKHSTTTIYTGKGNVPRNYNSLKKANDLSNF